MTADEDRALVAALSDLDVVLGAGDQAAGITREGSRLTAIVKADASLGQVAVVTLTFDRGDGRPTVDARLEKIK